MRKQIRKNFDEILNFLSWCEDESNIDIHEPLSAIENIKQELKASEKNCKSLKVILEEIAKEGEKDGTKEVVILDSFKK